LAAHRVASEVEPVSQKVKLLAPAVDKAQATHSVAATPLPPAALKVPRIQGSKGWERCVCQQCQNVVTRDA
jgi:hypothetical protein